MTSPTALFDTVVIVGVGLIGGSIGLGLRGRFLARKVIGMDQNPQTLETALRLGVIDEARLEMGDWLADADLIILATPVGRLVKTVEQLILFTGPQTVFTDVGSVKKPISDALQHLLNYVPGHPMAGSEKAGVEHADPELLKNAVWVLTPTANTPLPILSKVRRLVEQLGAMPVVMPPDAHDQLVATVSHLPYLTALALSHMVARDERLGLLAAGGFRDLTRVASGNPRMSRDMVIHNKHALREAISRFRIQLEHLEVLLDNPEELLEAAEEGKRTRDSIPVVRRSLLPALHDLYVAVPDRPGMLGKVTQVVGEAGANIKDIEVLAIRDQGASVRLGLENKDDLDRARVALESEGFITRGRA